MTKNTLKTDLWCIRDKILNWWKQLKHVCLKQSLAQSGEGRQNRSKKQNVAYVNMLLLKGELSCYLACTHQTEQIIVWNQGWSKSHRTWSLSCDWYKLAYCDSPTIPPYKSCDCRSWFCTLTSQSVSDEVHLSGPTPRWGHSTAIWCNALKEKLDQPNFGGTNTVNWETFDSI